jgi:hypothetical protein
MPFSPAASLIPLSEKHTIGEKLGDLSKFARYFIGVTQDTCHSVVNILGG